MVGWQQKTLTAPKQIRKCGIYLRRTTGECVMLTKQEAFNIAARGIIDQGGPSVTFGQSYLGGTHGLPRCSYRGDSGSKCAIGHLIPDQEYNDRFDSFPMSLVDLCKIVENLKEMEISFLNLLQNAHDGAYSEKDVPFLKGYKERMHTIANIHHLNTGVLLDDPPPLPKELTTLLKELTFA
jgi:hypothetical protein